MPTIQTSERPTAVAAKLFRGLGDPMRLGILLELQCGERRVVDLVAALGSSQANISGHLACLKDCGLVSVRPVGRQAFYSLAHLELCDLLQAAETLLGTIGTDVALCTTTFPAS